MSISEDNTRIIVTLPRELKEKLKSKANKENRSVSNFVVNLIKNDIEEES